MHTSTELRISKRDKAHPFYQLIDWIDLTTFTSPIVHEPIKHQALSSVTRWLGCNIHEGWRRPLAHASRKASSCQTFICHLCLCSVQVSRRYVGPWVVLHVTTSQSLGDRCSSLGDYTPAAGTSREVRQNKPDMLIATVGCMNYLNQQEAPTQAPFCILPDNQLFEETPVEHDIGVMSWLGRHLWLYERRMWTESEDDDYPHNQLLPRPPVTNGWNAIPFYGNEFWTAWESTGYARYVSPRKTWLRDVVRYISYLCRSICRKVHDR